MNYFVNLPLSWVARDARWLDWFVAGGINPELGFDALALAQSRDWHKTVRDRLREAGLRVSVHLPFLDLSPADADAAERKKAAEQLHAAAELAALYQAHHMIGHPGYDPERHGQPGPNGPNSQPGPNGQGGGEPDEAWLERSRALWDSMPERGQSSLYLENIYDPSAAVLCSLMRVLARPEIGICFDAGHWHCFSGGWKSRTLKRWLSAYSPWLRHLHLHDNDGHTDAHLGLGEGSFPWGDLAAWMTGHAANPGITHEPHTLEALLATMRWFAGHPDMAARFHWTAPRLGEGPLPPMLS